MSDEDINVYDYVEAETLGNGDNIVHGEDYLENIKTYKEGDTQYVKGYSIITGDEPTYFLTLDTEVGLWMV